MLKTTCQHQSEANHRDSVSDEIFKSYQVAMQTLSINEHVTSQLTNILRSKTKILGVSLHLQAEMVWKHGRKSMLSAR